MPKTPTRTMRIPDEEWEAAQAEAERRGESVTEAVRAFLKRYVAKPRRVSDRDGDVII